MQIVKKNEPVAAKEHICMWCGGTIKKGEKYERATLVYDGTIYDWINHLDCRKVTSLLNMFESCDDNGLGENEFREQIFDYIHWMYTEDDAARIWDKDDIHSAVKKIIEDWDKPFVKRRRLTSELRQLPTNKFVGL